VHAPGVLGGYGFDNAPPDSLPSMEESESQHLTTDEAFRAAFYLVDRYLSLDPPPSGDLSLLWAYLQSDPARAEDWADSIRRAKRDPGWGASIDPPERNFYDFERDRR
jgi:hypothetical protein